MSPIEETTDLLQNGIDHQFDLAIAPLLHWLGPDCLQIYPVDSLTSF